MRLQNEVPLMRRPSRPLRCSLPISVYRTIRLPVQRFVVDELPVSLPRELETRRVAINTSQRDGMHTVSSF